MTANLQATVPDYVMVDRKGSGRVVHRGRPHGVSSVRTLCGRLLLRVETAGILDHAPAAAPGRRTCVECERRLS